jgi:tight adherence protein C
LAALVDDLGPDAAPVAHVLVDGAATGAPLGPPLAAVAATARDRRRREAEAAARRLPVQLLFPLVCCILPAFGLLAVVPLLAASLRSLAP